MRRRLIREISFGSLIMLHGDSDILTNTQSTGRAIIATNITFFAGKADVGDCRLLWGDGGRALEVLHAEIA